MFLVLRYPATYIALRGLHPYSTPFEWTVILAFATEIRWFYGFGWPWLDYSDYAQELAVPYLSQLQLRDCCFCSERMHYRLWSHGALRQLWDWNVSSENCNMIEWLRIELESQVGHARSWQWLGGLELCNQSSVSKCVICSFHMYLYISALCDFHCQLVVT